MMQIQKELRQWLDSPGNNKIKLAAALGYSSTNAIDMWFQPGRNVPARKHKQLLSIIRKGKK